MTIPEGCLISNTDFLQRAFASDTPRLMYAGNDYPRTKWQFTGHEDFKTWMHNRQGLFPGLHTLMAFAIFGVPVITGVELGSETNVRYWIGWHPFLTLVVPVLLIISHLMHVATRKPQFNAMLLSTVIPALVVIAIGYSVIIPISGLTDRLFASDCTTYSDKTYLEAAYNKAADLWATCLEREVNESHKLLQEVKEHLVLDECEEYQAIEQNPAKFKQWRAQWEYLRFLEISQSCSGWCNVGQESLWTTDHEPKDVCASTVGSLLSTKIKQEAGRMLVSGLISLVVSLVVLISVQEYMIRLGVEW